MGSRCRPAGAFLARWSASTTRPTRRRNRRSAARSPSAATDPVPRRAALMLRLSRQAAAGVDRARSPGLPNVSARGSVLRAMVDGPARRCCGRCAGGSASPCQLHRSPTRSRSR
jgi:hypothetical protein